MDVDPGKSSDAVIPLRAGCGPLVLARGHPGAKIGPPCPQWEERPRWKEQFERIAPPRTDRSRGRAGPLPLEGLALEGLAPLSEPNGPVWFQPAAGCEILLARFDFQTNPKGVSRAYPR